MTDWNELISDVVAGRWKDETTGKTATVPFEVIRIEDEVVPAHMRHLEAGIGRGDAHHLAAEFLGIDLRKVSEYIGE